MLIAWVDHTTHALFTCTLYVQLSSPAILNLCTLLHSGTFWRYNCHNKLLVSSLYHQIFFCFTCIKKLGCR